MSISDIAASMHLSTESRLAVYPVAQPPDSLGVPLTVNHLIFALAQRAAIFRLPPHLTLLSQFPPTVQQEIYNSFGSYGRVCQVVNQILLHLTQQWAIADYCQRSKIGKKLPNALYVHLSAIDQLDPALRLYESWSRDILGNLEGVTLVKFHTHKPVVSYLYYPDFDDDPHPALVASLIVNIQTSHIKSHDYSDSDNPPILHRKETFVTSDYPDYQKFARLTKAEEKLGLLESKPSLYPTDPSISAEERRIYHTIGTRKGWMQHLARKGVEIRDHRIISIERDQENPLEFVAIPKIERHKAALVRRSLSRPVRLAVEADLFTENTTFFDYGCGYGGDIQRIAEKGYESSGWDPYYSPDTPLKEADIVNLGYIINVIECQQERRQALLKAWELTKQVLIVAAQILIDDRDRGIVAYGDGVITNRNTFQKYYEQEELKIYIDQVLEVNAVPIDMGVYFVFRDETQAENFRASRFRSRLSSPKICTQVKRFEDYEQLLQPLIKFVSDRGRLPVAGELSSEADIREEFGTFKRAFKLILQATDPEEWEKVADRRRQDFLVYLALSQFSRRPKISQLSEVVQNDIKGLFGSYKKACILADLMLYSMGNPDVIADCCSHSPIGQKYTHSLWVHLSALEKLDPLLRLYEGCANRTLGRLAGATLVKFHIRKPKITYLFYPDFDTDPHPALHTQMEIDLRDLHVTYQSYEGPNPPILHCKQAYVTPEYPQYEKFAKLTRQEEDWGLLDDFQAIKTRQGWLKCLEEHCAELRGHRVYWRTDADPYRRKLIEYARRARQKTH
ncbi:DNA phosphorothioation-associated methyltransferase [Limnoraphis robusta CS-951]|uniref:DNA phosphorothioation-associated methyltransferase n=2 Tax=Limnoraphis TaxID=1332112 RepID=A0A0F5YM02_9CYAN|nr:DNA phosphorothioation-associated putative methyltransferase [Limnoraphis robusta]KKD39959.1 DNA phosphorothioation-associated methyltransferase [Limnoraphis robusta CS-951]